MSDDRCTCELYGSACPTCWPLYQANQQQRLELDWHVVTEQPRRVYVSKPVETIDTKGRT